MKKIRRNKNGRLENKLNNYEKQQKKGVTLSNNTESFTVTYNKILNYILREKLLLVHPMPIEGATLNIFNFKNFKKSEKFNIIKRKDGCNYAKLFLQLSELILTICK